MAENEIKEGDVVMLKSGGPAMTVSSVYKQEYGSDMVAWCAWFEGKKATGAEFKLHMLKHTDPD